MEDNGGKVVIPRSAVSRSPRRTLTALLDLSSAAATVAAAAAAVTGSDRRVARMNGRTERGSMARLQRRTVASTATTGANLAAWSEARNSWCGGPRESWASGSCGLCGPVAQLDQAISSCRGISKFNPVTLYSEVSREMTLCSQVFQNLTPRHPNFSIQGFFIISLDFDIFFLLFLLQPN
jgi:hypothetical protein